jgi:CHAT domain-containing protein/tetratricopeptide (TPR) repeat protein
VKSSHAIAPALILTVVVMIVQSGTRGVSNPKLRVDHEESPKLRELRRQGNVLFRAGEYLRAIRTYENGYEEAKRSGSLRSAVRFLNNLGSARYKVFQYRAAVQAYLEARDLATSQGDRESLGALCVNLSSLYFDMGDIEASLESAQQGLKQPDDATTKFKALLLIQCARINGQQKHSERAVILLLDAIEASRAELDISSEAQAWNELGNILVEGGQLQSAERALLESFRLRKLTHDDRIHFSYESLGNLRALQGDSQSALMLLNRAVDAARVVSPSATWSAYYDRGKVKLAQRRWRGAFTDFGAALKYARRWRAEVLPADEFRISTEVELHQVYSSFIQLGSRLYAQTGQKHFAEDAFAAAEECRAASLRALWVGPDLTKKLPNEYWETLANLHRAETALMKDQRNGAPAAIRTLRLRVAEMEALAGLDSPRVVDDSDQAGVSLIERVRRVLRPKEVFVGFHLGDAESCLWVIANQGFEFRRLPPRAHFVENVGLFVKALRKNSPEAVVLGNRLYTELFGSISRRLLDKPLWILAPDGPLFELPFAALVEGSKLHSDTPLYVVERHAIQLIPGISVLYRTSASDLNGLVVGLGDPIYNRADPRLPHGQFERRRFDGGQAESNARARPIELARLMGSAREIENCAKVWRSHGDEPIVLRGATANKENLVGTLRRNPTVVHLAAHVLFPTEHSGPGAVALALQPAGEVELFSATEIASMRLRLGLVVLNGCGSGSAVTLPGAGLLGMTRAWLAAGARAVIVTRWAMDDQDEGELFLTFYERFSALRGSQNRISFAELLQQAQLTELRAGGQRANPAHWAAYFCVERN